MKHSERAPYVQLVILGIVLVTYGLLQFWVIPTYVNKSERKIASKYTGYSFTIASSLIFSGNIIAGILDEKK